MSSKTRQASASESFLLGDLAVFPAIGIIEGAAGKIRVEPKVMELLQCLRAESDTVVSREEIEATLWGKDFIAEDAVARLVSKLRKALGDSASAPQFIETIPKRGYRLIASVDALPSPTQQVMSPTPSFAIVASFVVLLLIGISTSLVIWAEQREPTEDLATYYYQRLTPEDMAQSAALFRKLVDKDPSAVSARAGLSSALAQSVLLAGSEKQRGLTASLRANRHQEPRHRQILDEALAHAEFALSVQSDDVNARKAKALTLSAMGRLDEAAQAYRQVIGINQDHWPAMLNLGEIVFLQGDQAECVKLFEEAFLAMRQNEADDPEVLARWGAPVAKYVANYHLDNGDNQEAEKWFLLALFYRPLYDGASKGLELAKSEGLTTAPGATAP